MEGEWDGLLAGLDAGRYDIMINGVDVTEKRAEAYDFSEPYAYNRTAIIVSADNTDITSMEDLEGKRTANTISTTYAEATEAAIPFRKGEERASLREAVNQALADMRQSGALTELSEEYFGTDITQPAVLKLQTLKIQKSHFLLSGIGIGHFELWDIKI